MNRWWMYILELENGKWYVGITSKDPEERFKEHVLGKRAAYWTMLHKPIRLERFEDLGVVSMHYAEEYENKITRLLMKERGLNNVRGGDLTSTDEYTKRFGYLWQKELWYPMTVVVFMMLVIIYLLIDKFFL